MTEEPNQQPEQSATRAPRVFTTWARPWWKAAGAAYTA